MTQDVYKKETLNFTYTQSTTKAAYIGIFSNLAQIQILVICGKLKEDTPLVLTIKIV